MARYYFASGDYTYYPPVTANPPIEGYSGGTTAIVRDTTIARWPGGSSMKAVGTTTNSSYLHAKFAGSISHNFMRAWFRFDTPPANVTNIMTYQDSVGTVTAIALTPTGGLRHMKNRATPTQIGSDWPDLPANTWFCVHLYYLFAGTTNGNHHFAAYVNGEAFTVDDIDTASASLPAAYYFGWVTAPGNAATIWIDDLGHNSNTSAYHNTYPSILGRVQAVPLAGVDSNIGWHTCQSSNNTTEANLLAAVSSLTPLGHADATTDSVAHQIRNITNGSVTPAAIEYRCQSYGRAGVQGNVYLEPGAATYSAFGNTAARTRIGQGFYLSGTLELPRLWLRKQGTPTDNVILSLCTDSSGVPGTVLQTSTIDGSTLTTTAAAIDFGLAPEPLTPKTKYWITMERSGVNDASNYYQVETCADIYRDGGESLYNTSWGAATATVAWHMKLYSTEGAAVLSTVTCYVAHGEAVGTGTKTGTWSVTNPTVAGMTFNYGDDAGAAGAFATNWAWRTGGSVASMQPNNIFPNAAIAARIKVAKTDSGTRAALVCMVSLNIEWQPVEGEWQQFTKIAGGATWYGKHMSASTNVGLDDATNLAVDAGDWLMVDAMLNEGEDFDAATTISVTDAVLRTDYTLVGPAG